MTHGANGQSSEVRQHLKHFGQIQPLCEALSDWHPVQPDSALRSHISLFAKDRTVQTENGLMHARQEWLLHGYVVSAYANGWVRVSPPQKLLTRSANRSKIVENEKAVKAAG